jgi:hypothetical protein
VSDETIRTMIEQEKAAAEQNPPTDGRQEVKDAEETCQSIIQRCPRPHARRPGAGKG